MKLITLIAITLLFMFFGGVSFALGIPSMGFTFFAMSAVMLGASMTRYMDGEKR